MRRIAFLVAIGVTVIAESSNAQARTSASVDLTVGAGDGKGGELKDRDLVGARIAGSIRHWRTSRVGIFGELAMDFVAVNSAHLLLCAPSPRGGCKDSFPSFYGPTAAVGAIAPHRRTAIPRRSTLDLSLDDRTQHSLMTTPETHE